MRDVSTWDESVLFEGVLSNSIRAERERGGGGFYKLFRGEISLASRLKRRIVEALSKDFKK